MWLPTPNIPSTLQSCTAYLATFEILPPVYVNDV